MNLLVSTMVGRDVENTFPERKLKERGEEVLRVENLTGDGFRNISFTLHRGEILGLAGLVGAGRTEVCKAVFGEHPLKSGKIFFENKEVRIKNSKAAIELGIAYATEDRKYDGLMLGRSIRENSSLANLKRFTNKFGLLNKKEECRTVDEMSKNLSLKTPGIEQLAKNLSGGNQQKVCLIKWLLTDPKVIIIEMLRRAQKISICWLVIGVSPA
jgi:ABC-type sugar transport system ATPase subunit